MLTQREAVKATFDSGKIDIKAPVKKVVEAVKKQTGVRIHPNLVSTVRQEIIRNGVEPEVLVHENDGFTELFAAKEAANNFGGVEKLMSALVVLTKLGVK